MAKLENAILRDPTTYSNRTTKRSQTIGTSGHFMHQGSVAAGSLLPSIRILKKEDMITHMPEEKYLGEGRFGTCYLRSFNHYKVASKLLQLIMKMLLGMKPIYCQNLTIQICHTFLVLLLEKSFHS